MKQNLIELGKKTSKVLYDWTFHFLLLVMHSSNRQKIGHNIGDLNSTAARAEGKQPLQGHMQQSVFSQKTALNKF